MSTRNCLQEQFSTYSTRKYPKKTNNCRTISVENLDQATMPRNLKHRLLVKKIEMDILKDRIFLDERDVAFYKQGRKFRPGDFFRFKDKSIEDAMDFLEARIALNIQKLSIKNTEYNQIQQEMIQVES